MQYVQIQSTIFHSVPQMILAVSWEKGASRAYVIELGITKKVLRYYFDIMRPHYENTPIQI